MKSLLVLWIACSVVVKIGCNIDGEHVCQMGQELDPSNEGEFHWTTVIESGCPSSNSDCHTRTLGGVNVQPHAIPTACQTLPDVGTSTPSIKYPVSSAATSASAVTDAAVTAATIAPAVTTAIYATASTAATDISTSVTTMATEATFALASSTITASAGSSASTGSAGTAASTGSAGTTASAGTSVSVAATTSGAGTSVSVAETNASAGTAASAGTSASAAGTTASSGTAASVAGTAASDAGTAASAGTTASAGTSASSVSDASTGSAETTASAGTTARDETSASAVGNTASAETSASVAGTSASVVGTLVSVAGSTASAASTTPTPAIIASAAPETPTSAIDASAGSTATPITAVSAATSITASTAGGSTTGDMPSSYPRSSPFINPISSVTTHSPDNNQATSSRITSYTNSGSTAGIVTSTASSTSTLHSITSTDTTAQTSTAVSVSSISPPLFPPIPVYRDCTLARDNGYITSGVYDLSLLGIVRPFWCDMDTDGGGWMVFQRRRDGSVNFATRTWLEYEAGFGDVRGEMWLGNSALKQMTSGFPFELRVDLYDWEGNHTYAWYQTFKIGSNGNKYDLEVSMYDGTAGDGFSYGPKPSFSTMDRANDDAPPGAERCMQKYGGGWWTKNCFNCNLNSYYHNSSNLPDSKGIVWVAWRGKYYALKETEMKMRIKSQ